MSHTLKTLNTSRQSKIALNGNYVSLKINSMFVLQFNSFFITLIKLSRIKIKTDEWFNIKHTKGRENIY